jgi:hypothetical protein
MAKGRDRMSAQDKTLGQFKTVINQSGSMGNTKPKTLAQQIAEANKTNPLLNPQEAIDREDAFYYERLNSNIGLHLRKS